MRRWQGIEGMAKQKILLHVPAASNNEGRRWVLKLVHKRKSLLNVCDS